MPHLRSTTTAYVRVLGKKKREALFQFIDSIIRVNDNTAILNITVLC